MSARRRGGDNLITKKDLVVSVLCTFCLATVLFTMMPVQSAEWDPWLDVKEDGRINVLDLIKTASALGAMGDTTKNVNVTNWPSTRQTFPRNLLLRGFGYKRPGWGPGTWFSLSDQENPYNDYAFSRGAWASGTISPTLKQLNNFTFVYDLPPLKSYEIQGCPTISIRCNVTNSVSVDYFYIVYFADFGVVSTANEWTAKATSPTVTLACFGTNTKIPYGLMLHFPLSSPITIATTERLAIRVFVSGYTEYGTTDVQILTLCWEKAELMFTVPIVENP